MDKIEEKDIIFIINPNSGRKQYTKIEKDINKPGKDYKIVISNDKTEFDKIYNKYINNYKVTVIIGGDGTVNSAARKIYKTENKILAIYPTGSGNGFAKELGFKNNLNTLIEDIKKGEVQSVDVLKINEQECINIAGLGFDAYVAHDFIQRKRRGLISYIISVIKSVFTFKSFYIEIINDQFQLKKKVQMLSIANSRQFGNGAYIAPEALPNDGMYDLILVKPFPFYYYPVFVIKLMSGTLKESKFIKYFRLKSDTTIRTDFNKFHIDGEPLIIDSEIKITISDKKLPIIKTRYNKFN